MKRKLVELLILFLTFNFSVAQVRESFNHDNLDRSWIIYTPKNYSETENYPLLIALHGGGGNPKQLMNNTRKRFNKLADRDGFIVVYPQGVKKSWNDNSDRDQNGYARKQNIDDVGFIKKMITQLEDNYNINSDAIFVCGISNGGLMSQTLAMELPEKIRAIGLVASNFGATQIEQSENVTPFSAMFIHGVDDPVFPYDEGLIGVFNKPRGQVFGIDKSIDYMCNLNGNNKDPIITSIKNKRRHGCNSEHLIYPNTENPLLKVELIKVYGGGHTWPGAKEQRLFSRIVGKTTQDFSACDKLWSFFKTMIN